MKVCLICAEFFGWGTSGGFGFATRILGRALVERGIDVYAVIAKPGNINEFRTTIDGIKIIGYKSSELLSTRALFKEINADIYQSMEVSWSTYLAQQSMPGKKHIISFQDPRIFHDWYVEFMHPTHHKLQVLKTWFYYEGFYARRAVKKADGLYCPAKYLTDKVQQKYGLKNKPGFLPTPISIPEKIEKAKKPTILFLGRLDRVKRPEIFLDLAPKFPDVDFLIVGKAHNESYEKEIRKRYETDKNIDFIGYIDQFSSNKLSELLSKSWILLNTSAKEALANTFVEAAAHKTAIVSRMDPDKFTSSFGLVVEGENYEDAIKEILKNNLWQEKGEKGYLYALENYESTKVIDQHIAIYESLIK